MTPSFPVLREYFIDAPKNRGGAPSVVRVTDDDDGTRAEVWTAYGWVESKAALRTFWERESRDAAAELDELIALLERARPHAQPQAQSQSQAQATAPGRPPRRRRRIAHAVLALVVVQLVLLAITLATR
jgi:hypothetical protein